TTVVSTVSVSPASDSVNVGLVRTFTAVARNSSGTPLTRAFTWTTSSAAVATVVNGVVSGVSAGTATITASADGVQGTAAVKVLAIVSSVAVAVTGGGSPSVIAGQRLTL